MQEVRYTSKPTAMMIISLLLVIAVCWHTIQLIYSIAIVFPPTVKTTSELIIFIVGLICLVLELVVWFRRRNTIVIKLSSDGVWTRKTGWLNWQVVELKVDKWRDVLSIAYNTATSAHIITWRLSELNISSKKILAIKEELFSQNENGH